MQVNNFSMPLQNFAGGKKKEEMSVNMDLREFVNASDEELFNYVKTEHNRRHKHDTAKFIGACVGVDALSSAILKSQVVKRVGEDVQVTSAPLSAKIGAGCKSVKSWGLGFVAVGALMGVKNVFLNKSEKFRDMEEQHPMMSFLGEIGALVLGYKGAKSLVSKLGVGEKLAQKTAPLTNKIGKVADKLDKSKFATFVMNRGHEITNAVNAKAPAFGKTCRILMANSVLIMLIGGMMKLNHNNKEIQQGYESLKFAQDQIRENMFV
ncbi:hypothetical protein IJ732_08135 [bacterium]|nr:hypothetical protein [bacterium]